MFLTTEVRWFGEGHVPPSVSTWFEQCPGDIGDHQERTDFYFSDPGSEQLGIKIREGRLEIKQLVRSFGLVQLLPQLTGQVGQWRKWSLALEPDQLDLDGHDFLEPFWIEVQKDRQLRSYQPGLDGLVTLQASTTGGIVGNTAGDVPRCDVELSSIQVGLRKWWSLAFEASGLERNHFEDLQLVIARLANYCKLPLMSADDSLSYPVWLARLGAKR